MSDEEYFPSDEDFDSWDEAKEAAAVAEIASGFGVRHALGDSTYFAKTSTGNVYKLPLKISISTFERLTDDAGDPIDAIKGLLREFAPDCYEPLLDEPIQVVSALLVDFMKVVGKTQGVELGE